MSKIKDLLKKLGVAADTIDKITSTDENVSKDINIEDVAKSVNDATLEMFKSDGTINEMRKQWHAAAMTARDKKIRDEYKAQGIEVTNEEYEALPSEERTLELQKLLLKKSKEKFQTTSPDEKDKEIERLNAEARAAKEKARQLEEEEIPKIKTDAQRQIDEFNRKSTLKSKFMEQTKGKLVSDENLLLPALEAQFNDKYELVMKDGKQILVHKGTTNQVFKDNKAVEISEVIDEIAKPFLKQSEPANPRRMQEPGNQKTDEGKVTPVGKSERDKALEAKQKEMEANK